MHNPKLPNIRMVLLPTVYACICTCRACEKCLSIELDVMKVIEADLIVV